MEMEHINENTIRVLIKSEDLAARGFTFLDLLGNQKEIESFFYSILEEVDIDDEFKGSEAVTFQVLPKGDGLELFISKSLPQDAMDGFEDFQKEEAEAEWWESDDNIDTTKAFEELSDDEIKKIFSEKLDSEEGKVDKSKLPKEHKPVVIEFANFELAIWLANEVTIDDISSTLYLMDHVYYLVVKFEDEDLSEKAIRNYTAHLGEFGRKVSITDDVLAEHGELIIENDAIETLRTYFAPDTKK